VHGRIVLELFSHPRVDHRRLVRLDEVRAGMDVATFVAHRFRPAEEPPGGESRHDPQLL